MFCVRAVGIAAEEALEDFALRTLHEQLVGLFLLMGLLEVLVVEICTCCGGDKEQEEYPAYAAALLGGSRRVTRGEI